MKMLLSQRPCRPSPSPSQRLRRPSYSQQPRRLLPPAIRCSRLRSVSNAIWFAVPLTDWLHTTLLTTPTTIRNAKYVEMFLVRRPSCNSTNGESNRCSGGRRAILKRTAANAGNKKKKRIGSHPIYTFSTAEYFWRLFNNNMYCPGKLDVGADFYCLKKPILEDPVCGSGVKLTVTLARGKSDTPGCLYTFLAMIGGDAIWGAVVNVRARPMWTKKAAAGCLYVSWHDWWRCNLGGGRECLCYGPLLTKIDAADEAA